MGNFTSDYKKCICHRLTKTVCRMCCTLIQAELACVVPSRETLLFETQIPNEADEVPCCSCLQNSLLTQAGLCLECSFFLILSRSRVVPSLLCGAHDIPEEKQPIILWRSIDWLSKIAIETKTKIISSAEPNRV